jgi:hypothetical protein
MTEDETKAIKGRATRAISPLSPGDDGSYFFGQRTAAGRELPQYYLVYFLLVDLLGFPSTGVQEKIAWSVPVKLGDKHLIIEHRKMGLGRLFTIT